MKRTAFTAKELFGMAYLIKKQKMYGIPDAMGTERNLALQAVLDGLVSQNVAQMDMDGHITLRPEYVATVNAFCDCKKCLTIHASQEDAKEQSMIFWACEGAWVMAEMVDDCYVFSKTDGDMIEAISNGFIYPGETGVLTSQAVVPQLDIVKAGRACAKGNSMEALRIIRQSGVEPNISNAIVAGLLGSAYYLGLVCMDLGSGACQTQALSYIYIDGILLSVSQTAVNLRTCVTFTPITGEDMRNTVRTLVSDFLEKEA